MKTCEQCGKAMIMRTDGCPSASWCSSACALAWEKGHPGEWMTVEDLTIAQRAELDAFIGKYAGSA